MLDLPAAGEALWRLYDETGIRPEYAIASLQSESGLRPDADNGAGYYGVNQINSGYLANIGVDPADYKTWPASAQIDRVVRPFWAGIVRGEGVIPQSGARVEQMNYLPTTLRTALPPTGVLTAAPSAFYRDNATAFDPSGKGYITVSDIAAFVARGAGKIQGAIAQTYALRPGEVPRDPVYGTDFGASAPVGGIPLVLLATGAVGLAAFAAAIAIRDGYLHVPRRLWL